MTNVRYIGIDYGNKKVGVALSDENGEMAFPHSVMKNDDTFIDDILALIRTHKATVVIGDSRANDGTENPIAQEAKMFAARLEEDNISVRFEPEFYTSQEAERIQGRTEMTDASAATLMLNSYLRRNAPHI